MTNNPLPAGGGCLQWTQTKVVLAVAVFEVHVVQPAVGIAKQSLRVGRRGAASLGHRTWQLGSWTSHRVLAPAGRAACEAWAQRDSRTPEVPPLPGLGAARRSAFVPVAAEASCLQRDTSTLHSYSSSTQGQPQVPASFLGSPCLHPVHRLRLPPRPVPRGLRRTGRGPPRGQPGGSWGCPSPGPSGVDGLAQVLICHRIDTRGNFANVIKHNNSTICTFRDTFFLTISPKKAPFHHPTSKSLHHKTEFMLQHNSTCL